MVNDTADRINELISDNRRKARALQLTAQQRDELRDDLKVA